APGLAIAFLKIVAASHGGLVTFWRPDGQGSTFTLRLPEAGATRDRGPGHVGGDAYGHHDGNDADGPDETTAYDPIPAAPEVLP
ncbi:two-component sensor histidine kinase, partial [Streptomyces sp. NPDC056728]